MIKFTDVEEDLQLVKSIRVKYQNYVWHNQKDPIDDFDNQPKRVRLAVRDVQAASTYLEEALKNLYCIKDI